MTVMCVQFVSLSCGPVCSTSLLRTRFGPTCGNQITQPPKYRGDVDPPTRYGKGTVALIPHSITRSGSRGAVGPRVVRAASRRTREPRPVLPDSVGPGRPLIRPNVSLATDPDPLSTPSPVTSTPFCQCFLLCLLFLFVVLSFVSVIFPFVSRFFFFRISGCSRNSTITYYTTTNLFLRLYFNTSLRQMTSSFYIRIILEFL